MDLFEDFPRIVQSIEQWPVTALFSRRKKLVLARDVSRMSGKTVRTEYFSSDRADELAVSLVGAAKEPQKSIDGFYGGNCGCHD